MTLDWSGFLWNVRDDFEHAYGPGPNYFSKSSIWKNGNKLHFFIRPDLNGHWQCSEIVSKQNFGFGTYETRIEGCVIDGKMQGVHKFDKNAVFSPFLYPDKDQGPDGTHEIDWPEISRWGNDSFDRVLNYSTYATALKSPTNNLAGQDNCQESYPYPECNSPQVHRMIRTKDSVTFQLLDGNTGGLIVEQKREGLNPAQLSQIAMPMHINFWLNKSQPPSDGKPCEVVISKFSFKPL